MAPTGDEPLAPPSVKGGGARPEEVATERLLPGVGVGRKGRQGVQQTVARFDQLIGGDLIRGDAVYAGRLGER